MENCDRNVQTTKIAKKRGARDLTKLLTSRDCDCCSTYFAIVLHYMVSELTHVIISDQLASGLTGNLAEAQLLLTQAQQDSIIAEYLLHALPFDRVPPSGAHCRDPEDIPVLDLAIWQDVDAIIMTDPDLLELDREFTFRIVSPAGFQELLADDQS